MAIAADGTIYFIQGSGDSDTFLPEIRKYNENVGTVPMVFNMVGDEWTQCGPSITNVKEMKFGPDGRMYIVALGSNTGKRGIFHKLLVFIS